MIEVVYSRNGEPAAIWVTDRERGIPRYTDRSMLKVICSALRIFSWVRVTLSGVELRTVSGMMPVPFRVPAVTPVPLVPYRDDAMVFPKGDRSYWEAVHIVGDPDNDRIADVNKKFLRPGLYYSALVGGGTIVGHEERIYVIPKAGQSLLVEALKTKGPQALSLYDSFQDPTVAYTDEKGLVRDPGNTKPWWKLWK